jgi:hypothetical protein
LDSGLSHLPRRDGIPSFLDQVGDRIPSMGSLGSVIFWSYLLFMKIITKPRQEEEAEIFSDFSGERFHYDIPEVTIKMSFNYGSKFDDSDIEFHLNEEEADDILNLIKSRLSDKTKQVISERLEKSEKDYEDSFQSRDWNGCDYYIASTNLYRYLLNYNGEESTQS